MALFTYTLTGIKNFILHFPRTRAKLPIDNTCITS